MIKKIKQQNGSSILIALALFLICAMVASSVIVAAASGSTRNVNRVDKQQAYLSISSAAGMLLKELDSVGQFVGSATKKEYGCSQYAKDGCKEHYTYLGVGRDIIGYKFTDCPMGREATILPELCVSDEVFSEHRMDESSAVKGLLKEVIEDASLCICQGNALTGYQTTFTIDAGEQRLPVVTCDFSMDSSYDITLVLHTDVSEYAVTIFLEGHSFKDDVLLTEDLPCTHEVYYKVKQGDHYVTRVNDAYVFTSGKKYIEKLNVTWDAPKLTKGDVTK